MDWDVPIGIALALGLGLWLGLRYLNARKRQLEIREFAASRGLVFSRSTDTIPAVFGDFELFNRGHICKIRNVVKGAREEFEFTIFDYRYTVGVGKRADSTQQTVLLLQSPLLDSPVFLLRPQTMFDSVGALMGFTDIDFEHHPRFSESFVLQGKDEDAIRRRFDTSVLDFFANHRRCSAQGGRGAFLLFYPGEWDQDQLDDLIAQGDRLCSLFRGELRPGALSG